MKVLKQKVLYCIITVLSIGNGVIAQNVADSLELPEVIITVKTYDREMRSSAPHHIIDSEQIGQLNALQLSDVVKHLPGRR